MAEKTKIQDTADSGFGQYDEANGGGTPVGGRFNGPSGRVGWKKRGEPGHRESQPRTKDGKFSYNSLNGKPLAPSSDPTRGKTVNPLLTGGKNGVMIKDVESQFAAKKGDYWDKYKDSWYVNGSESTGLNTRGKIGTKVSGTTVWEMARHSYDSVKGEFTGESENWKGKAGARSKEEKTAIQKQETTGQEQYVEDKNDNSIKRQDSNAPIAQSKITPTWRKKSSPAPTAPTPTPTANKTINPNPPGGGGGSAPVQAPQGQFLQAPNAAQNSNNQAGLTAANQAQLNALFGGSAPSNITGQAPQGPSLAGFQQFNANKKNNKTNP